MDNADSYSAEKRSDQRLSGDKLPRQLQTLQVSFGEGGGKYRAKTIDASASGISFKIEVPTPVLQNYDLTITTDDGGITLRDELVYAKPLSRDTWRVSVHFSAQPGLEQYAKLIDQSQR